MGYALAQEQQDYVARLVKAGRFNNQSEAVREAIRRMQAQDTEYLTPSPLTQAQVDLVYGRDDKQESVVAGAAFKSFRRVARKNPRA